MGVDGLMYAPVRFGLAENGLVPDLQNFQEDERGAVSRISNTRSPAY